MIIILFFFSFTGTAFKNIQITASVCVRLVLFWPIVVVTSIHRHATRLSCWKMAGAGRSCHRTPRVETRPATRWLGERRHFTRCRITVPRRLPRTRHRPAISCARPAPDWRITKIITIAQPDPFTPPYVPPSYVIDDESLSPDRVSNPFWLKSHGGFFRINQCTKMNNRSWKTVVFLCTFNCFCLGYQVDM